MNDLTHLFSAAPRFAPFGKGGGRPQSGRQGICSSRAKQIPHKPLSRLVAPFFKGGYSGCLLDASFGRMN